MSGNHSVMKDFHRLMKRVGRTTDGQVTIGQVNWDNNAFGKFDLTITPNAGLYKGGSFSFTVRIPENYSIYHPPVVWCNTDIYHPNIDTTENESSPEADSDDDEEDQDYDSSNTNVCLNLLDQGTWNPSFGLEGLVLGLLFLFHHPNTSDPLSPLFDGYIEEEEFSENVKKYMAGIEVEGVKFNVNFTNTEAVNNDKNKDDSENKAELTDTNKDAENSEETDVVSEETDKDNDTSSNIETIVQTNDDLDIQLDTNEHNIVNINQDTDSVICGEQIELNTTTNSVSVCLDEHEHTSNNNENQVIPNREGEGCGNEKYETERVEIIPNFQNEMFAAIQSLRDNESESDICHSRTPNIETEMKLLSEDITETTLHTENSQDLEKTENICEDNPELCNAMTNILVISTDSEIKSDVHRDECDTLTESDVVELIDSIIVEVIKRVDGENENVSNESEDDEEDDSGDRMVFMDGEWLLLPDEKYVCEDDTMMDDIIESGPEYENDGGDETTELAPVETPNGDTNNNKTNYEEDIVGHFRAMCNVIRDYKSGACELKPTMLKFLCHVFCISGKLYDKTQTV